MKERCNNPNHKDYDRYGAAGLRVCDRWEKFENFLEDMGERPKGTSLDRIDSNGHYHPTNCRWSTQMEQCNNKKNNVFVEFDGNKATLAQWSRKIGVHVSTLKSRRKMGWSDEEIITGRRKAIK